MGRYVIDIGHAENTWPPSKGVYLESGGSFSEHSFNYAVGMAAKELAEYNGHEIVLSQESYELDRGLKNRVQSRIKPLHKVKPFDALFSIHANYSSNPKAKGHGVFHFYNSTKSKRLAEVWDGYATRLLWNPDWGSADGIWKSRMGDWTQMYMLYATPMPAILIEHFFFSNMEELKKCNTPEYIAKAAECIVRTMCEWSRTTFRTLPEPQSEDEAAITANELLANIEAAIQAAEASESLTDDEVIKFLHDWMYKMYVGKE